MRYIQILLITLLLIIQACDNHEIPVSAPVKKEDNLDERLSELLKSTLVNVDTITKIKIDLDSLQASVPIAELFKLFDYKPIWTSKGKLLPQGDSLIDVIKNARNYFGLYSPTYRFATIDSLLKNVKDTGDVYDAAKLLKAELYMTDALFSMAVHINKGRFVSDSIVPAWKINEVDTNLIELFFDKIKNNKLLSTFHSLEPQSDNYVLLKSFFNDYLKEFENETWDTLIPIQQDTAKFYSLLPARLIPSHDYDTTSLQTDDKKLMMALKSFQKKHGLNDDGKIGKYTYVALRKSKEDHIRQLEMTLERWRWEPTKHEKRRIWVNIPSFQIKVYDNDTVYWKSRVITGSLKHHSPTLKSIINYFIIYPYWNVPYKIASEEILPRIKWDTTYLRKNRFDVIDWNGNVVDYTKIKWSKYNKTNLPYRFRQQEGGDNSLGVIKFMFNNKYGVYLHDTNGKGLFNKEVRALSHGCIRLENPWTLASYLIKDDSLRYTIDSLYSYFEKEQKKTISLRRGIPLYIKYFTCEVLKEEKRGYKGPQKKLKDQLFFFLDIYGDDKKLMDFIYK